MSKATWDVFQECCKHRSFSDNDRQGCGRSACSYYPYNSNYTGRKWTCFFAKRCVPYQKILKLFNGCIR